MESKLTRRGFLKVTGLGAGATAVTLGGAAGGAAEAAAPDLDRAAVVSAIGDTLIPTDAADPGYRTLEVYNITAEVLNDLDITAEDLDLFNSQTQALFAGKKFVQLDGADQARYFDAVFAGGDTFDKEIRQKLQGTLGRIRQRVFQVFYGNYPEHALQRDGNGVPILPSGDAHQITNPNSKGLVTGWDVAGFMGPLTWEEEERRRAVVKKIDWKE